MPSYTVIIERPMVHYLTVDVNDVETPEEAFAQVMKRNDADEFWETNEWEWSDMENGAAAYPQVIIAWDDDKKIHHTRIMHESDWEGNL